MADQDGIQLPELGERAATTRKAVFSHGGIANVSDVENIKRVYLRLDEAERQLRAALSALEEARKLVESFVQHDTHDDCYWCRDLRHQAISLLQPPERIGQ